MTYIYVGTPIERPGAQPQIQMGDRMVDASQLSALVAAERSRMTPAEQQRHLVVIKADRHIPMSLLRQVKDALRRAHATRIIYTANDKKR